MADLEADILIIGAGASGGVAAHFLAQAGLDVLCLEQGEWPDADKFASRREDYELHVGGRWHANPNERQTEADYPCDISESDVDISMVNAVGGGTVLWSAIWHRLMPSDFRVRSLDGVARDWPLSYEELAADYDAVEEAFGVSGLAGDPAFPPKGAYPLPPFPMGGMGMHFAETMNRLAWHWWPGTNAIPSRAWRGLNACVRRGNCMMGCGDGAKASTDRTHWPEAVAAGARLVTGARVQDIPVDAAGLATGAVYIDRSGTTQRVRAGVVILCANGIGTPRLLMLSRSGQFPDGLANSTGLVGRGLMLHPTGLVSGVVEDESFDGWLGPTGQLAYSLQFYESEPSRGFVRGSKWSFVSSGGPMATAMALPMWGTDFQYTMRYLFRHTMNIVTFAEDLPEEHNRITLHPDLTDSDGLPAVKVHYRLSENTTRILDFNQDRAAFVLRQAGAKQVFVRQNVRDFGGAHLMGTARMGDDPATSVVDRWGRTHDVPNLYIFDGSVFPTSGAVNPTATIAALALRFSRRLAEQRRDQAVAA